MSSSDYSLLCTEHNVVPLPFLDEFLRTKKHIKHLDLRGVSTPMRVLKRRINDTDVEIFSQLLTKNKLPCDILDMGSNEISDKSCSVLGSAVAASSSLLSLNLRDNQVTGTGIEHLTEPLRKATSLRALILDGNQIGDTGAKALSTLIQSTPSSVSVTTGATLNISSSLHSLSLARCQIGMNGIIYLTSALRSDSKVSNNIVHLDLSEPVLFSRNEETIHHIGRMIKHNHTLRSLSLRKHPYLVDSGIEILCEAILEDSKLQELDLSYNHLGPPSGVYLSQCLISGATIRSLNLAYCRISNEGCIALSNAIRDGLCNLLVLDLRNNDIGDSGLVALSEALVSPLSNLRMVRIWGNSGLVPGSIGCEAIGSVLLANNNEDGSSSSSGKTLPFKIDCRAYMVDGKYMLAEETIVM